MKAIEVARCLINLAARESEPELLDHMRLQKLLYYAQGFNLAVHGEPLFDARIEAWVHGPVVREVYAKFADYEGKTIPPIEGSALETLSSRDREMIRYAWDSLKQYSGLALREMTHREQPWLAAREGLGPNDRSRREIAQDQLRLHFKGVFDRHATPGLDPDALALSERSHAQSRGVRLRDLRQEFGDGV